MPELIATARSSPVATIGGSATRSGTAWRCMFEPISARLASSCSRNGIRPAETPTICLGEMSMYWIWSTGAVTKSVWYRAVMIGPLSLPWSSNGRVGRRQVGLALLVGPHPDDVLGHLAVLDLAVGGDQEAVLVDAAVDAQRADQPDVGPFGRLDRADAAVVRDVDVADLEAGALAVEPAGAQGAEPPLVGELRQRVGLVDDLRELAAAEEVLDRRADALGVDQRARGHVLGVLEAHPLLDGAAELEEALAQLVGGQLVDGAQPAVAQVVDVVDVPLAAASG